MRLSPSHPVVRAGPSASPGPSQQSPHSDKQSQPQSQPSQQQQRKQSPHAHSSDRGDAASADDCREGASPVDAELDGLQREAAAGGENGTVGDEALEPLEELIESMRVHTPAHTPAGSATSLGSQRHKGGSSGRLHRASLLGSPASRASGASVPRGGGDSPVPMAPGPTSVAEGGD